MVGSVGKQGSRLPHYVELLLYFDIMGGEGVGNSRVLSKEDSCQPLALALCLFCLERYACLKQCVPEVPTEKGFVVGF